MQLKKKHQFIQTKVFRLQLTLLYLQIEKKDYQNALVHDKEFHVVVKVEVSLKILTHFHSLKSMYIALKIQDFKLSDITGNRSS